MKILSNQSKATNRDFNTSQNIVRDFLSEKSGSFVPAFAVSVMAFMLSAGAAVDYSQLSRSKAFINQSLDSAVLAAGNEMLNKSPNDARLRTVFEDHLNANLSSRSSVMSRVTIRNFKVDRNKGTIGAELDTPLQTSFLGLIGKSEVTVHSYSEVSFSTSPVEVSMMLDVTGSMGSNGKLDDLKLAAQDAIDILMPSGGVNNSVRVGLVPYAAGVNGGAYAERATGTARSCATERASNADNDASYRTNPLRADPNASCPAAQVTPLSNNANMLKGKIRSYRADGYTAGHLGIGWSYYLLSENWKSLWPRGSKPDNYGGKTKKIAILMTDGEFNTFYRGVSSNHQGGQARLSNAEAIALCNDMKRAKRGGEGITIYSVAFQAPASAKATLQACATPDTATDTHFFDANSGAELRTAFREIATSIKSLRLSK